MTRTRWLVVGVAVIVAGVAFAAFRPDTLFTDRTVDEKLDSDVAAAIDRAASDDPADPDTPSTTATDAPTETPSTTAPTSNPDPSAPVVLATGSWQSVEHDTAGGVAVVRIGARSTVIFDELATDNGPDLAVWVSTSGADTLADSVDDATRLEGLKGNRGTQSYDLPAELDAAALRSVVIWCDRFSVAFGVAELTPA